MVTSAPIAVWSGPPVGDERCGGDAEERDGTEDCRRHPSPRRAGATSQQAMQDVAALQRRQDHGGERGSEATEQMQVPRWLGVQPAERVRGQGHPADPRERECHGDEHDHVPGLSKLRCMSRVCHGRNSIEGCACGSRYDAIPVETATLTAGFARRDT